MKHEAPIGRLRRDLAEVSKPTFGKQYRLEIGAVICALDAPIWSRRVSQVLDIPENQVASELGFFADRGALMVFPAEHDRRKLYEVVEHPLWGFARQLFERSIQLAHPDDWEALIDDYWAEICGGEPKAIPRGSAGGEGLR